MLILYNSKSIHCFNLLLEKRRSQQFHVSPKFNVIANSPFMKKCFGFTGFTGVDDPYEPPLNSEVCICIRQ